MYSYWERKWEKAGQKLSKFFKEWQNFDICTPTFFHKQFTLHAAQVGKHIICEKPIARTVEDAEEMVRKAEKRKILLLIGHVVRFSPEYIKIRELVQKGEVDIDAFKQQVISYNDERIKPIWHYWGTDPDLEMIKDFVICIKENRHVSISGEDGKKALAAVLAAYRSIEKGEPAPSLL